MSQHKQKIAINNAQVKLTKESKQLGLETKMVNIHLRMSVPITIVLQMNQFSNIVYVTYFVKFQFLTVLD
jgi:hypothetical protein